MPQKSETQRTASAASARSADQAGMPGLLPTAAVVALSAVVCGAWLMSDAATAPKPEPGAQAVVSELAQVDDQDVTAALATMIDSANVMAQFKQRSGACPPPLAWVSVALAPGQPAATIRLRSGAYFSPVFNLSNVPVRVTIPYPAPYETGHGTLTAMDAGGAAIIALLPAWHVPAQTGDATRPVSWRIGARCKSPNG
jgi:hypothetical protein